VKADKARSKRTSQQFSYACDAETFSFRTSQRFDRSDPEIKCPNSECSRMGPFRAARHIAGMLPPEDQIARIPGGYKEGVPPRELDVELEDDLVEEPFLVNRVIVNGVLKFYPRRSQASKSNDFNLFFKSISIENMGAGV